uniref:alanine:cation symporter family protein n=1 Tax=uncultured Clostridium sp. TaxID=59620 RepID=UPI0025E559E5
DLTSGATGIQLTQAALSSHVGSWGSYFIAICILLFAFSSIIGNYYYGESNIEFLSKNKYTLVVYRILVIAMVFIGSIASMDLVWTLADVFMGLMAISNLIAIVLLGNIAIKVLNDYRKQKKAGIVDPVFKASSIPELKDVEEWQ